MFTHSMCVLTDCSEPLFLPPSTLTNYRLHRDQSYLVYHGGGTQIQNYVTKAERKQMLTLVQRQFIFVLLLVDVLVPVLLVVVNVLVVVVVKVVLVVVSQLLQVLSHSPATELHSECLNIV